MPHALSVDKKRTRPRGRLALRASATFVAIYVSGMTAVFLWGARPVEERLNLWTARTTGWTLWLLGAHGRSHADFVESSVSTVRIISECTALYPAVIFLSAVAASPAAWKHKFVAAAGVPVLAIVNLIRIVSLCYIGHWFPGAMDTAHYVVGQSLMIFVTLLLWLLWASRFLSLDETAPS